MPEQADQIELLAQEIDKLTSNDLSSFRAADQNNALRMQVVESMRKLARQLETPLELSRRLAWQEPAHLISIKIATSLGIFENLRVQTAAEGCARLETMAVQLNQPEELLGRMLRHLAAWDTVREVGANSFAATATSNAFLDAGVASGPDFWINLSSVGMRNLPGYLQEHGYGDLGTVGKGNFEQANGKGLHLFEWLKGEPVAFRAHTDHLNAFTSDRVGWLDIYPARRRLSSSEQDVDSPLLVDVGGGIGRDALMFRRQFPDRDQAVILQDLPDVIADAAKNLPSDSGITLQAVDFFDPQPVQGARLYLLHYILHDWADTDCLTILNNIKVAMRKDYSSLLIVESMIATEKADTFSTALDITIMCMVGSRERSEKHWRKLIDGAGMCITFIYTSVGNAECVIEVALE